jgi:PAS domain S-box-containing protein
MQVDAKRSQNRQTMLQDILRTIAENPKPQYCVPMILQTAQSIADSAGACYLLFGEFETCITAGDNLFHPETLEKIARALPKGLHINPLTPDGELMISSDYLVAPIYLSGVVTGAFAILLPHPLTEDDHAILTAIVDGLTIVTMNAEVRDDQQRAYQLTSSLLNSIPDPLLVLDEDKCILLMNPAAEKVFEMASVDARGKRVSDVVRSETLMEIAQTKNKNLTEWVSENDKTFVPRTEPVYDSDGRIEGWVLALRDITHFKKLNRNQNEFTRIVSHDLRSPLTSMQGFADMLEGGMVGELNERQKHFVEKILSGISQMTSLVDNIQDAGRYDPETGFYEMSRSQCDLGEIVRKIVDNHLVPAEKQELEVLVNLAPDIPILNADGNMLERAITNLVDNAIKYTPNGGKIEVGVRREGENVIVSVADNGLGISPENQKHLFDRHVRIARQEHKKIKGSGLGLFIVRSVAQRHGGNAWVVSAEGKGTTFYMSIPLDSENLVGSQQ